MYSTHAQMHLMTPQGHLVHLAMVYGQSAHLCGIINFLNKIFSTFYLTILGQLDNTSYRKLAHIQRLILLNYYFNSFTDNTVGTLFLGNMWPVSTTGPKVIFLFFYFFPDTVVSIQLGKIPTLGSRTKIHHYTTHTWMWTTILACCTTLRRSPSLIKIHVSLIFQTTNPNNRDNLPQIQHFLSPTKGIPRIFAIFETISPV